jgi:alcohol dehydrogenase (NADP+)
MFERNTGRIKMIQIPKIGIGTFGSDHVLPADVAKAVEYAIGIGYRQIDCASVYGNEVLIGHTLSQIFANQKIKREDLWITSKLWNDKHAKKDVIPSCKQSLKDLQLDYLDLYLVHWPFPNYHPPKCDVTSRSPNAHPYIHEEFMETWKEMEKLVNLGLVKHIGTSNMTIPKLELLLRDAHIKPEINEMELHPDFQQKDLREFLKTNSIQPIGFCPLGSPERPERDRTSEDAIDMEDPIVKDIAAANNVHPAAICLKWAAANGIIPIPFSTNPKNIESNFNAVMGNPLTDEEIQILSTVDKNSRLIKGQVFLWKGAKGWQDIWDPDGNIPK